MDATGKCAQRRESLPMDSLRWVELSSLRTDFTTNGFITSIRAGAGAEPKMEAPTQSKHETQRAFCMSDEELNKRLDHIDRTLELIAMCAAGSLVATVGIVVMLIAAHAAR